MPNHVTNHLNIYGPPERLDAFTQAHVIDGHLSFQTVIPMPAILDGIPSSSRVDDAIEALTGVPAYDRSSWTQEERDRHAASLLTLSNDDLAMGRRALDAKRQTGHVSWYGWNTANWGTKWDAYHGSTERDPRTLFLMFDTAWSTPDPILHKLAEMWPDLAMSYEASEEFGHFAVEAEKSAGESTWGRWDEYVPDGEDDEEEDEEEDGDTVRG